VHSLLEGVVTTTGYAVSVALGMVLSTAMAAHLLPEALAVVAVGAGWAWEAAVWPI
jgi:zinc transporter ZupT